MITVKLYGLLRIESGIREQKLDAGTVKEVLDALMRLGIAKKNWTAASFSSTAAAQASEAS